MIRLPELAIRALVGILGGVESLATDHRRGHFAQALGTEVEEEHMYVDMGLAKHLRTGIVKE